MKYSLLALIIFFSGCKADDFKTLPKGPIAHQLIALGRVNDGIRLKGFSGATPANTNIMVTSGRDSAQVVSEADGSFDVKVLTNNFAKFAEVIFTVNGKDFVVSYQIRDLAKDLHKVVKESFNFGKEISSISVRKDKALILSTNAALVSKLDISAQWRPVDEKISILLNPKAETNIGAYKISASDKYLVATLFNTHELALIDLSQNKLLSKTRLKKPNSTDNFLFKNDPPLQVSVAVDADGTGLKNQITDSFARNAEAVIALDDTHFLATFSNHYQFLDANTKSVVGPGIVALLAVEKGQLVTKHIETLKFKNPMYFLPQGNFIWLTCPGAWRVEDNIYKSSEAGMVKLKINDDKNGFNIEHEISLKDFSPTMPALINDSLVIPHSQHNEIAVIKDSALEILPENIKKIPGDLSFSLSFASFWHDNIVMLGDDNGSVIAYSLSQGFFPFPFIGPISIKIKDQELSPRIHELYFRQQVTNSAVTEPFVGYSAWAVSFTQGRIFALDLLAVFGP